MNKSHVKELFSQTLIYGVGIMLNKSVNFILLPVYTKYFSPEQIGLLTLVQSISFFFGIIYTFGLETAFMKFFIDAKDVKQKSEIYSSVLIFLFISSLVLSILIYFSSGSIASFLEFENTGESRLLIQILCVVMLVDTLYRFPLLLFRAELKTKTYAYINLFTFFVNIAANVIFVIILKKGIESAFLSYIISTLSTFILGLILTRKYILLKLSLNRIKTLLFFGNKFIYIGLFLILIDISDRFFLKYYFDESIVGVYSANYRLASVMSFMIAAFKFSWTPYFMNLYEHPDNKKIIASIFTYFVFAGLFLFLLFAVFMNELVKISVFGFTLLDINYWEGLSIIPIVLLAYFFSGLYSLLNAAPFFTSNTGSLLAFAFSGLIINTLLNFLLIPAWGMTGAALATLITYISMSVLIYIYSQRIYKINYNWKVIGKLCLITGIVFIVCYFFVNKLPVNDFLIVIINLILISLALLSVNYFKILELKKMKVLLKK